MFRTKTFVLAAGRERIVHVVAQKLAENLATGAQHPLVAVRPLADPRPEMAIVARHVEILGPSTLRHTPTKPLPGTNGRGIAYLVTNAAIRVHVDADADDLHVHARLR